MGREVRRARRAPGRTREERRALHGPSASQIVTAYCDRRIALGLPPVDRKATGALVGQAMRLLAGGRWEHDTLLAAAVEYAGTRRFPGYFEEWASQYLTAQDTAAHEAREQTTDTLPADVLAAIGSPLRRTA